MPGGKGTSCTINRAITAAKRHASKGWRPSAFNPAGPATTSRGKATT